MVAIFLAALDQTIVAVSLLRIGADLGHSELLTWIVTAYLLAATLAMPIIGKLGDLFGRRRMLMASLVLVLLGSVLAALAASMPLLIVARLVQGLGGGGLVASGQAVVGELVAPRERGRYQGMISATYALASMAGPLLGGYLADTHSWRVVFWLNLPLAALALLAVGLWVKHVPPPAWGRAFDAAGALLLGAALCLFFVFLQRSGQTGLFDLGAGALLLMSAAALYGFVQRQMHAVEPLMPLQLLRLPAVAGGCLLIFLSFFQLVSLTVLLPLLMQRFNGFGAYEAGLWLIAFSLAIPAGSLASGKLISRLDGATRPLQVGGFLLMLSGALLLAAVGPEATPGLAAVLALCGFGIGLTIPASLVAVQSAVPARHIGIATGIFAVFRSLGGACGLSLQGMLLARNGLDERSLIGLASSESFGQMALLGAGVAALGLTIACLQPPGLHGASGPRGAA